MNEVIMFFCFIFLSVGIIFGSGVIFGYDYAQVQSRNCLLTQNYLTGEYDVKYFGLREDVNYPDLVLVDVNSFNE